MNPMPGGEQADVPLNSQFRHAGGMAEMLGVRHV